MSVFNICWDFNLEHYLNLQYLCGEKKTIEMSRKCGFDLIREWDHELQLKTSALPLQAMQ